jgi:hypothetical protein
LGRQKGSFPIPKGSLRERDRFAADVTEFTGGVTVCPPDPPDCVVRAGRMAGWPAPHVLAGDRDTPENETLPRNSPD